MSRRFADSCPRASAASAATVRLPGRASATTLAHRQRPVPCAAPNCVSAESRVCSGPGIHPRTAWRTAGPDAASFVFEPIRSEAHVRAGGCPMTPPPSGWVSYDAFVEPIRSEAHARAGGCPMTPARVRREVPRDAALLARALHSAWSIPSVYSTHEIVEARDTCTAERLEYGRESADHRVGERLIHRNVRGYGASEPRPPLNLGFDPRRRERRSAKLPAHRAGGACARATPHADRRVPGASPAPIGRDRRQLVIV